MKVKEFYYQQLDDQFELDLGYEEWLRDNYSDPIESEIMDMARENLSHETFIELMWHCFAANRVDYNPNKNKGA